jgi:hypothetical protein
MDMSAHYRMSVLNSLEFDFLDVGKEDIRSAILNNSPIDNLLHVIMVMSNPCEYARRCILAREFQKRMEFEENVKLYVVELAYGEQQFIITDSHNPRHLQVKTATPLWHKENMINLGIKKLLPKGWKAVAWIDADVEFDSASWALDTLKVLNGHKDIIQLFSHVVDMNKQKNAMQVFPAFGYQLCQDRPYFDHNVAFQETNGINMWHPGYAWACTRRAYDKMGGLFEQGILGSGDLIMAYSLMGQGVKSLHVDTSEGYKEAALQFQNKVKTLRLGYIPGVIRHHFHGSKKNRKYVERWQILVDNKYDPAAHITKNNDGLIIPTAACPKVMLAQILQYFCERDEDEGFKITSHK